MRHRAPVRALKGETEKTLR